MASTTFYLVVVACIAGCITASSTPAPTANDVKIMADPTAIHDGFTKFLHVNCSFYHGPNSDFSTIMSLILSKSSSPSMDDYSEVASMTAFSGDNVDVKDALGAQVSGHLQANDESFILLEWTYPSGSVEGKYKCEAYGMDKRGHPRVSSAVSSVTERAVDLDMVLENMKKMDSTLDDLLAYKSSLTQRLGNSMAAIMEVASGYGSHSYHLSHPMLKNAAVADSLCRLYGGYLAEINDGQEWNFVQNFIAQWAGGDAVAVGSTDEGHEGSWMFLYSGSRTMYVDWAAGQPDGQGKENCMYLGGNSTGIAMMDDVCVGASMDRFLCEIQY